MWKYDNVAKKKFNSYNISHGYLNPLNLNELGYWNLLSKEHKLKKLKHGYVEYIPCDVRYEGSMEQVMATIFGT